MTGQDRDGRSDARVGTDASLPPVMLSEAAGGQAVTFVLPAGGVDDVLQALAAAGQEPTFVYERLDAQTREPLRSWMGLLGEPVVLPSEGDSDPFGRLREMVARLTDPDEVVFAFVAFEAGRASTSRQDRTPSAVFVRPRRYLRFDHDVGTGQVVGVGPSDEAELRAIAETCTAALPAGDEAGDVSGGATLDWVVETSETDFERMAQQVQSRMPPVGGDSHGVVLSVRLSSDTPSDDLGSFRELRRINPSTCMFLLRSAEFSLWGATSLAMVQVADGRLVADTDGATRLVPELAPGEACTWQPTEKEFHEYDVVELTLREDLAKVAADQSLRFTRQREIRTFFGLQHLFAEAQADVATGNDVVAVVEALFPHGAVTGYPRRQALAAISETEPFDRGPFGGAIGIFGADGSADVACVSRSMWTTPAGSGVQAGAKVVIDSDPAQEYAECLLKTRAPRQSARASTPTVDDTP